MKPDTKGLKPALSKLIVKLEKSKRYRVPAFFAFVALIYGFVFFQINNLNNAQPSTVAVDSQVKATGISQVDQKVVKQLQSLQDNSVRVQALFDQARNNPFQE
jgi:hypothetical protein